MAITRVNKLGTANNTSSGLSSLTLTVTATTTARNRIIVPVWWGASNQTVAVTDSGGNTYVQDVFANAPNAGGWGGFFSTRADSVLTSGVGTITVTWTGGKVTDAMMAAYEYSGLANFVPLDVTHSAPGTSSSPNSGSATTTIANELVLGMIGWSTAGAITAHSYTELDHITGGTHSLETQENIVSGTGTFTVTGTLASTPSWAAIVAGYSDTSNGGTVSPTNTTVPVITGSGVVGMQLTCSQGLWGNSPTAYAYQWKRAGTNVATGAHYLVTTADVGSALSCVVTASNKFGSVTATASNTVTPAVNKVQIGLGI